MKREFDTYGHTIEESLRLFAGELPRDAVGLYQLVSAGDDFGLKDQELDDFVRQAIYGLLDAGAKPVIGGGEYSVPWVRQLQYGTTKEEIAEAIIAEWRRNQPDEIELVGYPWFAIRKIYGEGWNRVPVEHRPPGHRPGDE